jgi:pseudouridine synthase
MDKLRSLRSDLSPYDTSVRKESQGMHQGLSGKPGNRYINSMERLVILLNKPYGVLSQFTPDGPWESLNGYGPFPNDVYAAGRLDADSEGLLILTNDAGISHRLTDPRFGHPRTYLAQVERTPDEQVLEALRRGVKISGQMTRPSRADVLPVEPELPPRPVPIRFRKNVPTAWLSLTITEGRNRQVRKMTAAVGHPCLRLVRIRIMDFTLDGLRPGEHRTLDSREVLKLRSALDEGRSGILR